METKIDEIADGIYRLSTWVADVAPPAGFTFSQFLIDADEPLLFHAGHRQMFPLISDAVARIRPVEDLRWITFGHVEADECGGMNQWLAAAPRAQVAHGWEARVLYEETSGTLFCGDLFTHLGNGPALVTTDIVQPAIDAELMFHAMTMAPNTAPVLTRLADLQPTTLALMHGSSFTGDGGAALRNLATALDDRFLASR